MFDVISVVCAGKVKAIGVSNYTVRHLEEMDQYASIQPHVLQVSTGRNWEVRYTVKGFRMMVDKQPIQLTFSFRIHYFV